MNEGTVIDADSKPCPLCAETIKAAALKCRFCNSDLEAFAARKDYETEELLFSGNPAMFYSVEQFLPFLLFTVIAVLLAFLMPSLPQVLYIAAGFLTACGLVYLRFYLISRSVRYMITTQRIKLEAGLLSKKQESLELFRIDHFELRKSIGKRLLGHASLHLFSSDAEFKNFFIYAIPDLETLANTLRECQLRERTRRGLTTFVRA
jgi:hypothetical protein